MVLLAREIREKSAWHPDAMKRSNTVPGNLRKVSREAAEEAETRRVEAEIQRLKNIAAQMDIDGSEFKKASAAKPFPESDGRNFVKNHYNGWLEGGFSARREDCDGRTDPYERTDRRKLPSVVDPQVVRITLMGQGRRSMAMRYEDNTIQKMLAKPAPFPGKPRGTYPGSDLECPRSDSTNATRLSRFAEVDIGYQKLFDLEVRFAALAPQMDHGRRRRSKTFTSVKGGAYDPKHIRKTLMADPAAYKKLEAFKGAEGLRNFEKTSKNKEEREFSKRMSMRNSKDAPSMRTSKDTPPQELAADAAKGVTPPTTAGTFGSAQL